MKLDKRDINGAFTFLPMDDIVIGEGCVGQLGDTLEKYGVKRALLVTGNTLYNKTNLVDRIRVATGGRIAEVFHETEQHVPRQSVIECAKVARAANVDAVISFGGGSPNDTAKAIVLSLAENIESPDVFDEFRIKFEYPDKIEVPTMKMDKAVPLFAIPTTLSAGEFTHIVGITDETRKVKDLYVDKHLAAKVVFLDPNMTMETPEWLWLSSGMRSVDHAVEALYSTTAHPFTDALSAHALVMLHKFLLECKADPNDKVARLQCQIAAWMSVSGLANVSLGLSHGTGHQLGARCGVPHGITSCVMLHHTMRFNKEYTKGRLVWIAQILGTYEAGMSDDEAADVAADTIQKLTRDLGLPDRLRDANVSPNEFQALAEDALQDMIVATNPRPVSSPDDVIELLKMAY